MSEKPTPKNEMVEIDVTVDNHTHAGKPVAKGSKITVPPAVAKTLKVAWAKEAAK